MKSRRSRIILFLLILALAPALSQEPTQVIYYSGASGGFTLKAPAKVQSYFMNIQGESGQCRKLMVEVKKSGAYKGDSIVRALEPSSSFSVKYLFKKGPGEYTVILFGNKDGGNYYNGLCTFTVQCSEEVPESALKAEQEEFRKAIKAEIDAALAYLNRVRANPEAYSKEIGVSLKGIAPLPALVWDERLAASAEKRAADMAKRNYFNHVNPDGIGPNYYVKQEGYALPTFWSAAKSANNLESISAGLDKGVANIINLINDNGAGNAAAGHRIHLLGLNSFFKSHSKIGIGMAYNPESTYKYYFVIHTAPEEQQQGQ